MCFLTQRFPDERLEVRDVNLPTRGAPTALLLPRFRNRGGFSLELVSAKVHADGHGPHGQRKQLYRLCYVKVAGGGLAPLDLRRELEKLADFGGADSTVRKLAARLELLQSPSNPGIALELHAGDFSFVPEPAGFGGLDMSDGCGFVPDDLLLELVGGGVGALAAVRALIDEERLPVKCVATRRSSPHRAEPSHAIVAALALSHSPRARAPARWAGSMLVRTAGCSTSSARWTRRARRVTASG